MQDISDHKSVVTWRDFELSDHSIRQHVVEGMKITHLGVGFDEVMTCVIDQEGVVSKVKFIDQRRSTPAGRPEEITGRLRQLTGGFIKEARLS